MDTEKYPMTQNQTTTTRSAKKRANKKQSVRKPSATISYYQQSGMNNVLLFVPERLKSEIHRASKEQAVSLRNLYLQAIAKFCCKASRAQASGTLSNITFRATLRRAQGNRFQMWLDIDTAAEVIRLSSAAAVTKRAYCYTALLHAFEYSGESP